MKFLALLSAAAVFAAPQSALAAARDLSPLAQTGTWINGAPSPEALRGKVVVVDVFTFGCINCKNVTPNLRRLHASEPASDFAIVGVHAPETPYESNHANVVAHLAAQGVTWPVKVDNDFAVWKAYGVDAWPTQLIFDRHGRLRRTIVGDSQDAEVDAAVKQLLAEH